MITIYGYQVTEHIYESANSLKYFLTRPLVPKEFLKLALLIADSY
jgi:hypothetical protein